MDFFLLFLGFSGFKQPAMFLLLMFYIDAHVLYILYVAVLRYINVDTYVSM